MWIIRMDNDNILRQRHKAVERSMASVPYSAKDFQLEVLDRLEEMRSFAEALDESLIAYVIQDARNTARQDSEIEATKARVQHLEQIATTNTEARIRTEVQLGELRDGQNEIKLLIQAHDSASRKGVARK